MQRLPPHRIQRAYEVSEIGLEEHPAPAGLGSRDETALGARPDLFGVHVEKSGGFIEIEGLHAGVSSEADLTPRTHYWLDRRKSRLRYLPGSGSNPRMQCIETHRVSARNRQKLEPLPRDLRAEMLEYGPGADRMPALRGG